MEPEEEKLAAGGPEKTTAHGETFEFRKRLAEMFASSPLPPEELLFNLGLYVRSSLLVKFLVMNDLYERIKGIPGTLVEFGVWHGQNLVLLENLRAIHEPFNKQRVIVGFDTFDGYPEASVDGGERYRTGKEAQAYIAELLNVHEGNNAFGHLRGNHELVAGDVTVTAPEYFARHPEVFVALAYFDMGPYEPTLAALQAIRPHLLTGSVILFDELTWSNAPGEAVAFKQVFVDMKYTIEKCALYPSKSIVTIR
jgi:hypothetical protein